MKELFLSKTNAFFFAMFVPTLLGGCWILKNFNFHLGSRFRHPSEKNHLFEKTSLELLECISMFYNSCLIDWTTESFIGQLVTKKTFNFFFLIFFKFSHKFEKFFHLSIKTKWKIAKLLACSSIGEQKRSSIPSVYLYQIKN